MKRSFPQKSLTGNGGKNNEKSAYKTNTKRTCKGCSKIYCDFYYDGAAYFDVFRNEKEMKV